MKKILSLVLILAMALGMLAGCGNNDATTTTADPATGLESAKEYLYAMYKDMDGTVARKGFSLASTVRIDGVSYPVEWKADTDKVTITVDGSFAKVEFDSAPAERLDFVLTATIKGTDGSTTTVQISRYVEAKKASGVVIASTPVAGTSYKLTVAQNEETVNQTIYFTGNMSGYYLETTTNPFEAVDVIVEETTGGYYLYFLNGETKTYIDIIEREGEENKGKVNIHLVETPSCVFTWNADYKTFITSVAGGEWYLGCYKTYTTISASATSYINADNADVSQFPVRLATVNIEPVVANEPKADTAYKLHVAQNEETVGQNLYFTGKMSGYYLETTTNPGKAVNIHVEATTGGYYLYFLNGETKTYIDIIEREGEENKGKVNIHLVETPSCVFTWNADFKTFNTNVAGGDWYLGCYKTYTTISASSTSYINADNVDVSQFPARLVTVEGFMDEVELEAPCEHVEEVIAAKAATCTEDGLTEGKKCSICGEILTAQQTVKAAHTWGEWEVTKEATAAEEGEKTRVCSVCGEKDTQAIAKLDEPVPEKFILVNEGKYVTAEDYLYTSSSGSKKHELVISDSKDAAVAVVVRENADGTVTFVTDDGKFLMADGSNVQWVDTESEHTNFVLEDTTGGKFIKCAVAVYNGNAQYLEVYMGYLTCYGMNASNASIYTFVLESVG